jgi:hypothetical protein
LFALEGGSLVTKSIVTSSYFHSGISNGYSMPADFLCSTLIF